MSDTIWIDRDEQLPELAAALDQAPWIGIDTEFMREKTFFPKLCLLQICTPAGIWCVDTLSVSSLEPLTGPLLDPRSQKILHAARQDLEAIFLVTRQLVVPVFDTQIAAGCVGMKPQLGYADLAKTLLDVSIAKSETRTDWSRRPLSAAQMTYAADDVRHLHAIATALQAQLRTLGREQWVAQDCEQLANAELYDPDPLRAWTRLRGISQLPARAGSIARAVAVWRERLARERDSPRAWIVSDNAIFNLAHTDPRTLDQLRGAAPEISDLPDSIAASLLGTITSCETRELRPDEMASDSRPTPAQKALINRLSQIVNARASELKLSSEILATRGEIKALVMNRRPSQALRGWRREQIGERLLNELAEPIETEG